MRELGNSLNWLRGEKIVASARRAAAHLFCLRITLLPYGFFRQTIEVVQKRHTAPRLTVEFTGFLVFSAANSGLLQPPLPTLEFTAILQQTLQKTPPIPTKTLCTWQKSPSSSRY